MPMDRLLWNQVDSCACDNHSDFWMTVLAVWLDWGWSFLFNNPVSSDKFHRCWWEDRLEEADPSYNLKQSDSCRCFYENICRGQRSWEVRTDTRSLAGRALKQAVALPSDLSWSEITVCVCCPPQRFETDHNARLCQLHWIWKHHIHMHTHSLFLLLHTHIASLWTAAFFYRSKKEIKMYIKCTAHPDKKKSIYHLCL